MRKIVAIGAIVCASGMFAFANPAAAQQRLALVIGNDAYTNVTPLQKAVADARAYRRHFEDERGFDRVFYAENADEAAMEETIAEFITAIGEGDTIVVVYSGHGVQLDQNRSDSLYLIPTDLPALDGSGLSAEFRLGRNAISFSDIRDQIALRGAATRVFILDACRDNPLTVDDGTRSLGLTRGLAPIKTVRGEFVFFAAAPGERALDRLSDNDPSPNSVFSRVFLKHFKSGAFLEDIANDVQREVFDLSRTATPAFEQRPYYDDGIIGRGCIDEQCGVIEAAATTPSTAPQGLGSFGCDPALARELWDFARETNDCLGYEAFLQACADAPFAPFASAALRRLDCPPSTDVAAAASAPDDAIASATPEAEGERSAPSAPAPGAGSGAAAAAPNPEAPPRRAIELGGLGGSDAGAPPPEPQQAAAPRMSRYEARREILDSLAQFYQVGVETRYDVLRVEEGKNGIVAQLEGVTVRFPELDGAVSLATVAADLRDDGSVLFTLPERIVVEDLTPAAGAAATSQMVITSKALLAGLQRDEEGGYSFKIGAETMRLEPPNDTGESITLAGFDIDGRLAADPLSADASLSVALRLDQAGFDLLDGGEKIDLRARGLVLRFDGDADRAKGAFGMESVALSGPGVGALQFDGVGLTLDALPGDRFDFGPALAADATADDVVNGIVAAVYRGVLVGGKIDSGAQIAGLYGKFDSGTSETAQISARGLGAKLALGAQRMGLGAQAASFDLSVAGFLDAAGAEPVAYKFDDMVLDFAAEPGKVFDFTQMANAENAAVAGQALLELLRTEVSGGGRASLIMTNDAYEATTPIADPTAPFQLLKISAAGGSTEIAIEQNTASLAMTGVDFGYETLGGLEGRVDFGAFQVDAEAPLAASPREQNARVTLELRDIVLDSRFWAMLDPEGALDREIGGVSIQTMVAMTVLKDILQLDGTEAAFPVDVSSIALSNFSLEALGARVSAVGEMVLKPAPVGLLSVTLAGWRKTLDDVGKTPLGADVQGVAALGATGQWLEKYGVPGRAPGDTLLEIQFGEDGKVLVNGQPFEG